jgi:hypothetical protein
MLTPTQKNYRKQMQEIQNELNKKEADEYYSFIENDHISNYYKAKKKKEVALFPFVLIFIVVIGIYCYTNKNDIMNNMKNANYQGSLQGNASTNIYDTNKRRISLFANQSKISDDIQFIDGLEEELREKVKNVNEIKDTDTLRNHIEDMLNHVNYSLVEIGKREFQNECSDYVEAVINYFKEHIKYGTALQEYMLKKNKESNELINNRIEILNNLNNEQNKKIEELFERAGMSYYKTEDGYQYTY